MVGYFYNRDPLVALKVDRHKGIADEIVQSTSSTLVKAAFDKHWAVFGRGGMNASVGGDYLNFNVSAINATVTGWIAEFTSYKAQQELKHSQDPFKDAMLVKGHHLDAMEDIKTVIYTYKMIQNELENVENEFATATTQYRSPLHQALNDMVLLYNDLHDIEGDFTGYKNVSVYVHGIEDDGDGFLKSAKEASEIGDVIVHEKRNGDTEYYLVTENDQGEKVITNDNDIKNIHDLKKHSDYKHGEGRLHLVYETEFENEHRQDTSDKLAESLIEKGLLNDETKIDMFAHSYGGRRSLQFAIDYPNHVCSLTTIGTPYDTNKMASTANTISKSRVGADFLGIGPINKDPTQNSNYLDFNPDNRRTDRGLDHSTAYTDMASESMLFDLDHLKIANPEAYEKIENMNITAVAGRSVEEVTYTRGNYTGTYDKIDTHDYAVSVKSQKGEVLGDLIDERLEFDVDGSGFISPPHGHEVKDEEFIELIRSVNLEHKE